MTYQTHIWPEPVVEVDGLMTSSVIIENPDRSQTQLWYRVPAEHSFAITRSCDPFVVATVLMAMRKVTNLVVHGEVSSLLLSNLEEFQSAWACWRPNRYKKIEICPEVEGTSQNVKAPNQAISAFSGGVDSCFTVFRYAKESHSKLQPPLKAGLMVHGFDIPLDRPEMFKRAAERSRIMLASLGMELIPIATNFRQLDQNWEDVHGTAIASCLMLLQAHYRAGLIPSGPPYQALVFPWGSNPVTDRLLSSHTFEIIHDGAGFNRLEKIKKIANWLEALENLRVCYQGAQKDRNCGRCEKCIRTILSFRALGIGLPPSFEQDVSDRQILNLKIHNKGLLPEFERILETAKAAAINDSWVKALEKCIRRNWLSLTLGKFQHLGQKRFNWVIQGLQPLVIK